ncbi:hypothetical protein ACA910_013367 [Epithemia clementina (nom. ined.)]
MTVVVDQRDHDATDTNKKDKKKDKKMKKRHKSADDEDEDHVDKIEPSVKEKEEEEVEEPDASQPKRRRKRKRKKNEDVVDDKNNNNNNKNRDDAGDGQAHDGDSSVHEKDDPPSSSSDPKERELDRTVYVEGIPFSCTEEDVRAFFATHGALRNLVDVRLPVWQDSGRLRGYGHIVFATVQDQQKALGMNQKYYLQQRYISIQPAQAPKPLSVGGDDDNNNNGLANPTSNNNNNNPSRTLILNNLAYTATEEDIRLVMEPLLVTGAGAILEGGIRVVRHSQSGRSKGFAYVEFVQQGDAIQVYEQQQRCPISICGRPCRMDYDHGRIRGSFRTADRKLWHKEYKHNNNNQQQKQQQQKQQRPASYKHGHNKDRAATNDHKASKRARSS